MTLATTARRTAPKRKSSLRNQLGPNDAASTAKPTAYGRAVLKAIDRMKAAGPWEFAPRLSDRYFKR